jgi:F420-non-reducing hydrogenase iron-sulfur subunit
MVKENWEPKIVAFVCNWCTYTGADLAGTSRMKYQSNVRIIKLPCTGRIDPVFIIKAFEKGADGVLISGCHPGDCHYNAGNFHARRRWIMFKSLLDFVGIDSSRLHFSWVSASEGRKWVDIINGVIDTVRTQGPFEGYEKINKEFVIHE